MNSFVYNANPSHVIFGFGTSTQIPKVLAQHNCHAALILSTPGQVDKAITIKDLLGSDAAGVFSRAVMHTPTEITEEATQLAKDLSADSIISIGGGSTIGLGKAISTRTGLPHICIPTTYSGSEMTPILGETTNGIKTTRRDSKILPTTVIYDIDLTLSLPPKLSATSGINALAHAVEALYAPDTNPIIRLLAREAITSLSKALITITKSPRDRDARRKALYGAWLCGTCLGSTSMSLHHKLCHTLGGALNLPHAETHTVLLPHTFAYNSGSVPGASKDVAESLPDANGDAVGGLNNLLDQLGVERMLKTLGMEEDDIDKVAGLAVENPYSNPRVVEEGGIRELLRRAWNGEPARADL